MSSQIDRFIRQRQSEASQRELSAMVSELENYWECFTNDQVLVMLAVIDELTRLIKILEKD